VIDFISHLCMSFFLSTHNFSMCFDMGLVVTLAWDMRLRYK